MTNAELKKLLESLYRKYNRREYISSDPLIFAYDHTEPRDVEIAAFLASVLAYGRVAQIQNSLKDLFQRMEKGPYEFVMNFNAKARKKLSGFKHRFNTADDMAGLFTVFRKAIQTHGSLEKFFLAGYSDSDENILPALKSFCSRLFELYEEVLGDRPSRGFKYLLASPAGGSACKRLNLFLRWMVRDDAVDPGPWQGVDKAKLIVPIDTHMARLAGILGFHSAKTMSMKTAVQITQAFAQINPGDPVKYDFALTRIGIVESCTGKPNKACAQCQLRRICQGKTSG